MADSLTVVNFAQVQFALNPPTFFGYQNTTQTLSNQTWTSLNIDATIDDNFSGHSNSVNPSRYTCQVAGTYQVSGCYAPLGNSTGFRAVRMEKNGSTNLLGGAVYLPNNGTSEGGYVTPVAVVPLVVGDYVEVQGWQSSGGSLVTVLDGDLRCSLTVRFLHF